MADIGSGLAGRRILLVEDETVIAILIEEMLFGLGCAVIGPVARVPQALVLAAEAQLDGAVLDINVAGEVVFPVAERLAARGIPFVFATGYGGVGLPEKWRNIETLQKPFTKSQLGAALARAMAAR